MKKRAAPLKITDTSVPVRMFLPTKRYGIRGMKDPNMVEDPTISARFSKKIWASSQME